MTLFSIKWGWYRSQICLTMVDISFLGLRFLKDVKCPFGHHSSPSIASADILLHVWLLCSDHFSEGAKEILLSQYHRVEPLITAVISQRWAHLSRNNLKVNWLTLCCGSWYSIDTAPLVWVFPRRSEGPSSELVVPREIFEASLSLHTSIVYCYQLGIS